MTQNQTVNGHKPGTLGVLATRLAARGNKGTAGDGDKKNQAATAINPQSTRYQTGLADAMQGLPARATHPEYIAGYDSVPVTVQGKPKSPAKVPVSVPDPKPASAGTSLAAEVADLKAMILALASGHTQPVQVATTTPQAHKATKSKSRPSAEPEERETFDTRKYFSLGDSYAELDGAYVAESTDEKFSKNPIAIVGIQRKCIMLSLEKAERLYKLLALCFQ